MAGSCPSIERLELYAAGDEPDADLVAHLARCPTCAAELERISGNNLLIAEFASVGGGGRAATPSAEISGYVIGRELHRGAQGVVFEAVQTATKRRVAVKVLAGGAFATARQRHRFEREVEVVAALRHPNIVTLHDSGRTGDGGYFLVMELVEGVTLDEHVRTRDAGASGGRVPPWKLELFASICAAVNAAHQRGIMHRDLKPANILVDGDGRPRVLDFGLARRDEGPGAATGNESLLADTMAGEFLGTFAYASPEQVGGDARDVDIRSDVYALGVILYEILVGARPYRLDGSVADVVRTILDRDPPPPSRVRPGIDGDIDAITMTALAKEPARRYQSAGALHEDLRRHMRGDPINARRHHRGYVLRKTLARYRVAVIVTVLFTAALIVFGTSMAVLYGQKKAEMAKTTDVLRALLGVFSSEAVSGRSGKDTLPELFREVDRQVAVLAEYPEIETALRRDLGLVQLERGDRRLALAEFERVLAVEQGRHRPPHAALAEALHNCGRALWFLGRFDEAETRYVAALDMRRALFGEQHEDTAVTISHLAATHRQQERFEEAEAGYLRALALRRAIHGPQSVETAASLNNLGGLHRDLGRYDEAEAYYVEGLDMIRGLAPDDDRHIATGLHNVATCVLAQGDPGRARTLLEEALAMKLARYEDHHPTVASTRHVLADADLALGDVDSADTHVTAALTARERELDPGHFAIADSLELLARVRREQGRGAEAAALEERAAGIRGETSKRRNVETSKQGE